VAGKQPFRLKITEISEKLQRLPTSPPRPTKAGFLQYPTTTEIQNGGLWTGSRNNWWTQRHRDAIPTVSSTFPTMRGLDMALPTRSTSLDIRNSKFGHEAGSYFKLPADCVQLLLPFSVSVAEILNSVDGRHHEMSGDIGSVISKSTVVKMWGRSLNRVVISSRSKVIAVSVFPAAILDFR